MTVHSVEDMLATLLAEERLAVLATREPEGPYLSLMAFGAEPDLTHLVVATRRQSRKFRNLSVDPRVALLVDSRLQSLGDPNQTRGVSIMGEAAEVEPGERDYWLALYAGRNPDLRDFASAPDTALIKIKVDRFSVVARFPGAREPETK